MPKNLFPLDNKKSFTNQKHVGHNRWHPDIPHNVTVQPGDSFHADCREWFDGAIRNNDSADDVRDAPLAGVHVLSGPFRVEGAKPGDLLVVDILDGGPCGDPDGDRLTENRDGISGEGWGYTGVSHWKMVVVSSSISSQMPIRRSGTSRVARQHHATFPAFHTPVSSIQASWALPLRPSCLPSGQSGRRH